MRTINGTCPPSYPSVGRFPLTFLGPRGCSVHVVVRAKILKVVHAGKNDQNVKFTLRMLFLLISWCVEGGGASVSKDIRKI